MTDNIEHPARISRLSRPEDPAETRTEPLSQGALPRKATRGVDEIAWFKVDDKLHSHPKRHRAGLRAMGLWVLAGSWCGDHLTDGFVPADMLAALGGKPSDAKALVDSGLWVAVDGGWKFHDWCGQNPSRDDVEAQRAAWRKRQAEARERRLAEREAAQ